VRRGVWAGRDNADRQHVDAMLDLVLADSAVTVLETRVTGR
jgi:hypothetical protein